MQEDTCFKCGADYWIVQDHRTYIDNRLYMAVSPLCEKCWTELGSPEARIEYYAMLEPTTPPEIDWEDVRPLIQRAVANGG